MPSTSQTVAAVHGLCGHRLVMHPLCRRLRQRGYDVLNWGYRSLWRDIPYHADRFRLALQRLEANPAIHQFHIVAHSMDSIVTRVVLEGFLPEKLRRIVMICPPNRGSHVATRFAPWLGWLSTTLTQITDAPDSFVNLLTKPVDCRYEVGILRAENDFVVARESIPLAESADVVGVPGFHSSVLLRVQTANLISNFLETGAFQPSST